MATYSTQDGITFNLPDEGTVFRATGDNTNSAYYTVTNGKLVTTGSTQVANTDLKAPDGTIIKGGSPITVSTNGLTPVDPNFTGTYWQNVSPAAGYYNQTGQQYSSLPEFNMADINTVLQKTGGVWPTSNTTQTVDPNNPNGIVATNATGQVISQPNPAPQPGALTPTANNAVNPNVANPTTGLQSAAGVTPTAQPAQVDPALVNPNVAPGTTPTPTQTALGITGQPAVNQPAAQAAVSSYTGPSIVDYLNSVGQPSSYAARAQLAAQMGIQNYSGTADQNTKMLDTLRAGQGSQAPQVQSTTPTPPAAPSANVNTQLLSQYGVQPPNAAQSPMLSFVDSYKQILSQFGIPDIKAQFDKTQKEFDDLQNELNDKISNINDDPWLSEGVRQGRVQKQKDRYEGKSSILTNKLKLYDSLYKQGLDEAKFVAGKAYDQYQFDQNTQLKLYELGEKQLEAQQKLTSVSPGSTLYDPTTGQAVYTAPTTASQNATGGSSGGTFTSTQSNKGAANAGMSIAEFNALPADDKNYFLNSYSAFQQAQKNIVAKTQTVDQVAAQIRSSNLSTTVKTTLLKQLGAPTTAPTTTAGGTASGGALQSIEDFFGNAWNSLMSAF